MTGQNEHMDQQPDADELFGIVGELAISVWHLGYLVEEIGLDLGHNVGSHSAANAREAIRRHLELDELPPWADSLVSTTKLIDWLNQVDECVGAYHDVVQAFATARGRTPTRRLSDGSRHRVGVPDLKALLTASRELTRTGDGLSDALGLRTENGTVVHGYDNIIRTIYGTNQAVSA